MYLQLAIRREQTCLSNGYSFKFMGHDRVNDILHNKVKESQHSKDSLLTTCHPQRADLAVQRVQFQVHGTGQGQ